jgi:hypothetical protein
MKWNIRRLRLMKSLDCTNVRKLPLLVATGALLAGTASASAVELWVANNLQQAGDSNEITTFDSANPAVTTVIGNTGVAAAGFGGLDFHGDGTLYGYVSFGTTEGLYSINQATGVATVVGSLSDVPLNDLSYNPADGKLYGCDATSLYEVNTVSGAVTLVGAFSGTGGLATGMGHDAAGTIYVQDIAGDAITSGALAQTPLYATLVDTNFSQGMFVNWSADGLGYHGAIGNNPAFYSHLYSFPTTPGSITLLGVFSPDGDFPLMECGDVTAQPSGACPPSLCPWDITGPNETPDGVVDVNDLLLLLAGWGTDGPGACIADPTDTIDVNDLLGLLAAWGDCPQPPDPANDFCSTADDLGSITTTTLVVDSLVDATPDGVGACQGVANDGAGRWYVMTGTGSTITASLCDAANTGITFDGRISVFCGDGCSDLNCIAANDDSGCGVAPGNQPEVAFCTADGETYYVLVHMAAGGEAGDYTLVLDTLGDICEPDSECIPFAGDACGGALPISNGDTNYDTTGYGTDGNPHATCEFDGQTYHDIWFTYTADFTGLLIVTTCDQASYDTDIVVYDNSGPAPCPPTDAELLGCNDDDPACTGFTSTVSINVSTGDELLIRVGGWNDGNQGAGTLSLIKGDVFEFVCPDGASAEGEACVGNGDCDTPTGDVTNGGCNNCDPIYGSISCGESVCGTGYTYSSPADLDCDGLIDDLDASGDCGDGDVYGLRDTDWMLFTLDDAADVTLTCSADAAALFGIVDVSNCDAAAFVVSGSTGAAGGEIVLTASLGAGNWVAFAAPAGFTGHECGSELNWAMTLGCGEQATGACCTDGGDTCTDDVAQGDCAAQGGEFFANQDCADITCSELAGYQYDAGSAENGLGLTAGGAILWLHRFNANGGADTIVDLAASFGDALNGGSCMVGGEDAIWAVYQGDGSGNPGNATLAATGTFNVSAGSINTDVLQLIDIADTGVTNEFFIGVGVFGAAGCFEAPLDESIVSVANQVWIVGNTTAVDISGLDVNDLNANDVPPTDISLIPFAGVWMLRGNN